MDRQMSGLNYFTLWFGAAVSLAEIMTGSLIAPLGIATGIIIILAGHLIGTLILALVGVIGFREKSPALISSRLSLGRYGSYLVSIFNIVQLVGWTAIMLIQCTRSLQAVTGKLFGFASFPALVIAVGFMVGLWAISRERGINAINDIAVLLLMGLCILMTGTLLARGVPQAVTGSISPGAALELAIVMPLSWVPLISDYTMTGRSLRGSFWGSFAGYFLGSSFMYIIGLITAVYAGTLDPISIMTGAGLGAAALLVVILSTVTTTFMDVYSAVMSTLNLNKGLSRSWLVIVYTALGTALALVFPMEEYENFLYLIGSFFAPVFAVVIVDYFVLRHDLSREFCNFGGILAAVVGMAGYHAILGMDLVIGATLPAMLLTSAVYLLIHVVTRSLRQRRQEECLSK